MRNLFVLCVASLWMATATFAQIGINTDNSVPDNSAILDAKSTNKGFLPPRMTTTQMNAISSPAAGLVVYNTTLKVLCWFDGASWNIVTNRDGQSCGSVTYGGTTYNSVVIGIQCWMKENLNIGIAILGNQDQNNNGVIEKYCYNNISSNCDVYGGLYQWAEVVQYLNGATNTTSWNPVPTGDVQGICPAGWHLPSYADWTILTTYLGGEGVAGGKIKETGTTHWTSPNTNATNSSGFTALPGGDRYFGGTFSSLTNNGVFWSSTDYTAPYAWYILLGFNNEVLERNINYRRSYGFSVRCLQN